MLREFNQRSEHKDTALPFDIFTITFKCLRYWRTVSLAIIFHQILCKFRHNLLNMKDAFEKSMFQKML